MSGPPELDHTRRAFVRGGLVAAAGLATGGYIVGSNTLRVEHIVPRPWGLRRPLRVGLLTDLHAPNFRFFPETLEGEVRRLKLDVLAVVGDIVDTPGEEGQAQRLLAGLEATTLKVATLGNWEHWGRVDLAALRRSYEAAGFTLLVNDRLNLSWEGAEIPIIGLDDMLGASPRYGLVTGRRDDPAVVLSHCPATAEEIVARRSDAALILSGHTHGGQVAPFGLAPWTPPGSGGYLRGLYRPGKRADLVVSAGLGNSKIPFRVGAAPTLVVVEQR